MVDLDEPNSHLSFLAGRDGTMEAVKDIIGKRSGPRYTRGSDGRTLLLAALTALETRGLKDPLCVIDGVAEMRRSLVDSWAGELGWDSQTTADIIAAAKAGVLRNVEHQHQEGSKT